jgi:mannose-6-phosphate isomerase-like protein (cupin superfamily)
MGMELDVAQPVLLSAGGGEVVGDSPERRVEILCDRDELHATWTRFGPYRDGASAHVHRRHNDLFYVLAGELTLLVGPDRGERVLRPGTLVLAPPLVVHGFRNGSDSELRYLNFHAPGGGFAAYLRGEEPGFDSEDPPADGGLPAERGVIGTGEVVSDRPGLRVALLVDVDEIGIAEVLSEPGGAAPPLHVHRLHTECFYVLEGELSFTADGQELHATAGSWVHVPPQVPHTFAPTGSEPARYLDIHAPSCGFGDFARALELARNDEELQAARAQFDQEPA